MNEIYATLLMHSEWKRKRRIPFSFPLHLCTILDEDLVNGFDGKSDGLAWDKDHVFDSFEMKCKSHVKKS